jgi:hypothetical protein
MRGIAVNALWILGGLVSGLVFHYMLYRMGLPLKPFIYVAF